MSESVVVVENGQGRYQQSIEIGEHRLLADEPFSAGGEDAGPAPFDFLLTALGACTSMTLRMYAERKGLKLDRVSVELSHAKVDIDGVRRDRIERQITLDGELSPAERQRLLEIADKCPTYRSLSQPMLIASGLRDYV